jgi:hypothetical protein
VTAASAGFLIQLALLVATGLTALWGDGQALYAAAWHMLGGLPIWIILVLIYQQHESERVQRLAAEKLADGGRDTAAIFGNLSDDLDAARGRLERLYRYGLPIVSGIVAVYLLAAGGILDAASRLAGSDRDTLDASAMAARAEFRGVLAAAGGADAALAIAAAFATSRGGRNLVDLGMQADLPVAAAIDSLPVVPRLDRGRGPKDVQAGWLLPDAADHA